MRTPFDPRPLDPAPDPSSSAASREEPPQGPSGVTSGDSTPEATLAVVEAAMLVVDAAGIVDVGVRADAAALMDATRAPDGAHPAAATSPTENARAGASADGSPASVDAPVDAVSGRGASAVPGRTLITIAQFAATAAVLGFLAFGGRMPNIVAAAKEYFPKTRLAEILKVPSPTARAPRPVAQPRPEQAAAPVVSRPNVPAPVPATPVKKPAVSQQSPKPAATTRPKATPSVQARKPAPKATQRRATAQVAESRVEAPAVVPEAVKEQNRQEYYLRLMSEGHKLYQTGWYGPAMGRFKLAATVRPQSQNAYLWMARSAMRTGRYELARAAAERAIAISPNNDAAREARALLDQLKVVERERL
jgi:hypothetical protein